MRLWERIHENLRGIQKTLGENLQDLGRGFVRLWERIHKDSQDFGRGFVRIHENLGEDLQDFGRGLHKNS